MKKPWQSKTIILNFVVAAAALFYPAAADLINSHPSEVASIFALANIVLRVITKEKIGLSE